MMRLIFKPLLLLIATTLLEVTARAEDSPVILVNRRLTGDTYMHADSTRLEACSGQNLTYLIADAVCVNNQHLFDECGFSITPNEGPPILRITLDLVRNISRIEEHFRALTFTSDNRTLVDARIVVSNDTINGSFCHIASLEVYRGSKQSVVISHDGFSLSDEGNLLIDRSNLSYSIDEFEGELYRMNLSCLGRGLPERGCLFFKVGGQADVANATFNSLVQGTNTEDYITDHGSQSYATTVAVPNSTSQKHASSTINYTSGTNTNISIANINMSVNSSNFLLYVILGAVGGIMILLFIISILCGIIYCLVKGKSSIPPSRAAEVEVVVIQDHYSSRECLQHDLTNSRFERIVVINETECDYAQIEEVERQRTFEEPTSLTFTPLTLRAENETYDIANKTVWCQERDTKVANIIKTPPPALRRTQSEEGGLDALVANVIKAPPAALRRTQSEEGGLDALAPAREVPKMMKSRSVDYELCQIYDTVKPPHTKVRDDKTSYPGYPMKGLPSLYTNDMLSSSDALYTSLYIQSELGCGSAYDVPRKAALGYSVPHVKKRKGNQKHKGRSDEALTNPEEAQIWSDFNQHYDTPKCRNTNKNSLLYDRPRIQIHLGGVSPVNENSAI